LGLEKLPAAESSEKKNGSGVDRFRSLTSEGCVAGSDTVLFRGGVGLAGFCPTF